MAFCHNLVAHSERNGVTNAIRVVARNLLFRPHTTRSSLVNECNGDLTPIDQGLPLFRPPESLLAFEFFASTLNYRDDEADLDRRPWTHKPMSEAERMAGSIHFVEMNSRHSKLTGWGLEQVQIETNYMILDVGCGGGRTLGKLAGSRRRGKPTASIIPRKASPQQKERMHTGSLWPRRGAARLCV